MCYECELKSAILGLDLDCSTCPYRSFVEDVESDYLTWFASSPEEE